MLSRSRDSSDPAMTSLRDHHSSPDIIILGGGPAGSSAAIELTRNGRTVAVIEKRPFPREVLCGEFLSREVVNAIREFGLFEDFLSLRPNRIHSLSFTPAAGDPIVHPLGFEAYSLKRSLLDQMLLQKAEANGAEILQPAEAVSTGRRGEFFEVEYRVGVKRGKLSSPVVIAAYGKQSPMDRTLDRAHSSRRTGMNALKYHVPTSLFADPPADVVHLYSAAGVYCGINRVGDQEVTLCFLADQKMGHRHPIEALEVLSARNREFRGLFRSNVVSDLKTHEPRGAGNIDFGRRRVVENGVFMVGDAAAVIAPLAGDGIGMAMESGRLVARVLLQADRHSWSRAQTEGAYDREWRRLFSRRLRAASFLQGLAMSAPGAHLGGQFLRVFPPLMTGAIRWTRNSQ